MPDSSPPPSGSTTLSPEELEALKKLIAETPALNEAEKAYWLDLLPSMNRSQIDQLKNILETEKKNLEDIDKKYDKKLEAVAQKYLSRWDSEKAKSARLKRRKEEKTHEEEAGKKAEELLKQW